MRRREKIAAEHNRESMPAQKGAKATNKSETNEFTEEEERKQKSKRKIIKD